jgi:hypothetical protein
MIERLEETNDPHELIQTSIDIEVTTNLKGDIREIEVGFRVGDGKAFVQLLSQSIESVIGGEIAKLYLSKPQHKEEYEEALRTVRAMKETLKMSYQQHREQ